MHGWEVEFSLSLSNEGEYVKLKTFIADPNEKYCRAEALIAAVNNLTDTMGSDGIRTLRFRDVHIISTYTTDEE